MEFFKIIVNVLTNPPILISTAMILFLIVVNLRGFWKPLPAKILFALAAAFMLISIQDPNFRKIVAAPDNVPIVGMLFLVGFFVWYGMYKAKTNDDRLTRDCRREAEDNEKVLVWPNLVYTEMICLLFVTAFSRSGQSVLKAPLEHRPIRRIHRIRPRRPGIFSASRRCWFITIPGLRALYFRFDYFRIYGNPLHRCESKRQRLLHI